LCHIPAFSPNQSVELEDSHQQGDDDEADNQTEHQDEGWLKERHKGFQTAVNFKVKGVCDGGK
jgi:hypothetical protein